MAPHVLDAAEWDISLVLENGARLTRLLELALSRFQMSCRVRKTGDLPPESAGRLTLQFCYYLFKLKNLECVLLHRLCLFFFGLLVLFDLVEFLGIINDLVFIFHIIYKVGF